MEVEKSYEDKKYRKYNSPIFKNGNSPFLETKYIAKKNYRYNIETFSLKSKNTQSISTGLDDKKENVIRKSLSQKILNINNIINKLTENKNLKGFKFIFNGKRKGSTPEKNTKQIININSKETHYKNSDNDIELKYKERIKQNDSYIPKSKDNNSLKKNINNPLRKTFKEDNIYYNDNTQINRNLFKAFPPDSNCFYYYKYNLYNNNNVKSEKETCNVKISNVFYNHLVIPNELNIDNNSTYISLATIKRIKTKKLTILYFHPLKQI